MNPKHYSQIEKAIQCFDKSSTNDFLKGNQYLLFLFKKTERFAAALYILTELFPDTEPLKWELRSLGASLCKDILSFSERSSVFSKENMGDAFSVIIRVASLLEIAHIANLVSAMNLSLFRKELDLLASLIESRGRRVGRTMGGGASFPESFFRVAQETSGAEPQDAYPFGASRGAVPVGNLPRHSKEAVPLSDGGHEESFSKKKDISPKGQNQVKDTVLYDKDKGHYAVKYKRDERIRIILEVLKARNIAMIKDFSAVIKNCSEKTVQRELLRMVGGGLLKKEGERRWSRYTLV